MKTNELKMSNAKEQRLMDKYKELVQRIQNQTESISVESEIQKKERIKRLLGDWEAFCKYYFARFFDSEFAWFHKDLIDKVVEDENFFGVGEFPREHAKSVIADVFIPMYLKAIGELTGVLLGSANADKAKSLLSDLQAELQGNQLYIADFGEQISYGDWSTGHFKTRDGIGYWAFGRGQSPRGAREAEKRPNYGVIDDIDDKVIVKSPERVADALDWITEDFYGALSIKKSRLLLIGNRIHKNSILANFVGDVNDNDPKREGLYHLKVYAIEDPKTHEKAGENNGTPAWKERYTIKQLQTKMKRMGYRSSRREFFHEHIENGLVFKAEWVKWAKSLDKKDYDCIVTYTDPSFKSTKKSDYKAVVTVGKKGKRYHVLWAWVRQASISSMVVANHDCYDIYENFSSYWMEANMLQDLLMEDFDEEADKRDFVLPLRADKTKKPDKETRIENLTPIFERGFITFAEEYRDDHDMKMVVSQFLGFGGSAHDDAPDAVEGAITKLNKKTKKSKFKPRSGTYNKQSR